MNPDGVARIFKILGLSVPGQARLEKIANDGRSATEIRDDLLDWGRGQGEEQHRKMLRSLVEHRIGDATPAKGQVDSIVDQIISGEATIEEKYADIDKYIVKSDGGGGGGGGGGDGDDGGTTDDDPETPPGALAGGEVIRVERDGVTRYYQIYEFPPGSGSFISYQFNDKAQLDATYGEGNYDINSRNQSWFNENVIAESDAEEIIGLEGSFQVLTEDIMREEALASGITDPALIGQMMSDPEMQEIMAAAFIGDWSEQRILAEKRKTSFWKDTLYPGIENFYDGTSNPERAYMEYTGTVQDTLSKLGYERGADGTYKGQIEQMLDKGIEASAFNEMAPTFIRATQNADFAGALSEWAQRDLGKDIEFGEWFDLMQGEGQPELQEVAEKAQLEWVAQNQGTAISDTQIEDLAARSQLSVREAQQAFSEVNRSILAMGEDGLKRYGLDRNTVLEMAAGIEPSSGESVDEVRMKVAKIARENDLFDEEKLSFFTGFDEQGKPQRPGLQQLTPEGA